MRNLHSTLALIALSLPLAAILGACAGESRTDAGDASPAGAPTETPAPEAAPAATKAMGPWAAGDQIASGKAGVDNIVILEVHANGEGEVCGKGKRASLRYKAMKANGDVLDPGARPFTFRVGAREAIDGWDVIVAKMRVGDSFTLTIPQELAYGPSKGDLKFDMELLSFK